MLFNKAPFHQRGFDNHRLPISPHKGFFCVLLAFYSAFPFMLESAEGALSAPRDTPNPQSCDRRVADPWTWIDKSGNQRSRDELQVILSEHKTWIRTSFREGRQADLSGAKLRNVEIRDTDIHKANFSYSDLSYANLTRANLGETILRGANLTCAQLEEAGLHGVDLTEMDLSSVTLANAEMGSTILVRATLKGSVLRGVRFNDANLNEADLTGSDLTDAQFSGSKLHNASLRNTLLVNTYLERANLEGADLFRATYEVDTDPAPKSIAFAKNIEYMTHSGNSAPLARLRSLFKEAGFRDQERKITFALKARQGEFLWEACSKDKGSCFEYWANTILFDVTSQYGMNPGRVLIILIVVFCIATLLYRVIIHYSDESTLSIIVPADRDRKNQPLWLLTNLSKTYDQIHEGGVTTKKGYKIIPNELLQFRGRLFLKELVRREWVLLRIVCFFSLMSTFNIKFRDVDFGRWLRQLTTKEYDIKATGWARTVSGFQALLSVYFIALLLITYFGRPFE
jgi:uncharacterized protein YjbI with pentapeptide repeats